MADGSAMKHLRDVTGDVYPLDAAVARLEAGTWSDDDVVDLGDDLVVRADGPQGTAGLLQRLRGHARLLAISKGEVAPEPLHDRDVTLSPDVKMMLDAVRRAG